MASTTVPARTAIIAAARRISTSVKPACPRGRVDDAGNVVFGATVINLRGPWLATAQNVLSARRQNRPDSGAGPRSVRRSRWPLCRPRRRFRPGRSAPTTRCLYEAVWPAWLLASSTLYVVERVAPGVGDRPRQVGALPRPGRIRVGRPGQQHAQPFGVGRVAAHVELEHVQGRPGHLNLRPRVTAMRSCTFTLVIALIPLVEKHHHARGRQDRQDQAADDRGDRHAPCRDSFLARATVPMIRPAMPVPMPRIGMIPHSASTNAVMTRPLGPGLAGGYAMGA